MSLGLEHGINRLTAYSSDWPSLFTAEAEKIRKVCGHYILAIEHVGSTSIPNMKAKPIIDILVGVASLTDAEKMVAEMESIGYDYPGDIGIPDDRIFGRDPDLRKFLAHVVVFNSTQWNDYLNFRNALRNDTALASEYGKIKTAAVKKHPEGRAKYTELKSDFIQRIREQQR